VDTTPLFLNRDADYDWLIALPFGRVCDGHPPEQFRRVTEHAAWFLDEPGGEIIGFVVHGLRDADLESSEHAPLWTGARFDAPALALHAATAGEIAFAAQHRLRDESTINRCFFDAAVALGDDPDAIAVWRQCLETGDAMAHYGLGYSLIAHGRHREAHAHLREYVRLCPRNAWAWCYLGQAYSGMGEPQAARDALRRAVELEAGGNEETDAEELLRRLG
jgi:tetratricopeptide (TPR) repeat protein